MIPEEQKKFDEKIERFDKSVIHYVFTIGVSAITAVIITLLYK